MAILQSFLILVGALSTSSLAYRLVQFVYIYTRRSSLPRYFHAHESKPAWALVTGATAGIGRALAFELASRGFNVIVHSRSEAKLQALKSELETTHPGRTFRIAALDANLQGQELLTGIENLVTGIQDVPVTVLVNNVGGPSPKVENLYGRFEETKARDCDRFIDMNARFTMHLTHSLLPSLIKRQPALILTVGSMADAGAPYLSVYSGAKAFLTSWSTALAREARSEGRDIEIVAIHTGGVTGTSASAKPSTLFEPSAEQYASAVLDRVGCGLLLVNGWWAQATMKFVTTLLPERIIGAALAKAMKKLWAEGNKMA